MINTLFHDSSIKFLLVIAWPLAVFSSCSSLNVSVFHPRIDNPEIKNNGGISIYAGGFAGHQYSSTVDASLRPPNLEKPSFEDQALLGLGVDFKVANKIRIGVESAFLATQLKGQWQFLDTSTGENSEGWVASLSLGLGVPSGSSKTGDQDGLFGPGGNPWKGEVSQSGYWGTLSVGKRFNENFIGFAGLGSGANEVRAKIVQSPGGAGSNPPGTYTAADRGSQFTWGAGLVWGQSTAVLLKYESTQVRYEKASGPESINSFIIGVQF